MWKMQRTTWAVSSLLALLWAGYALAQSGQPVTTLPAPATTAGGNASGTITSTNTFQLVFAATKQTPESPQRRGCTIQNNGTHNMWVTEGYTVATATAANAVVVPQAGIYYCSVNNIALTGEIDITGTSGDAFYAAQY